jgi:hypothetical protein
MNKFRLALLGSLALAGANAMACYTVYDRSNRVVYNAQTSPVDMSLPLHQTLPRTFPGGYMVFGDETNCPVNNVERAAVTPRAGVVAANSPLLTDRRTAQAMNVPHTIVAGRAALVPAEPLLAARSPTQVMGAAPAPRGETVVTEMRDPPITVIQGNGPAVIPR